MIDNHAYYDRYLRLIMIHVLMPNYDRWLCIIMIDNHALLW